MLNFRAIPFLTGAMTNVTNAAVIGATPGGSAVGAGAGQGIGAGAVFGGARGLPITAGPGQTVGLGNGAALSRGLNALNAGGGKPPISAPASAPVNQVPRGVGANMWAQSSSSVGRGANMFKR
ncbi:MAG: hypothetical protein KC476_02555 [Cyanobacteria bacterium HKST-UBA06]|nr:hypothetical protein [Cyanobacteria bacterium HKST-UBA04]MCA9806811.1 hypothetical protein [Cyanobacteria bacterium HKST-UBA06]